MRPPSSKKEILKEYSAIQILCDPLLGFKLDACSTIDGACAYIIKHETKLDRGNC